MAMENALLDALFSRGDLINLKFFRGDRAIVTPEELSADISSAMAQVTDGTATISTEFVEHGAALTVDQFIATL